MIWSYADKSVWEVSWSLCLFWCLIKNYPRPFKAEEEGKFFRFHVGRQLLLLFTWVAPTDSVRLVASCHASNTGVGLSAPKHLAAFEFRYTRPFSIYRPVSLRGWYFLGLFWKNRTNPHPSLNWGPTVGWPKRPPYGVKHSLTSLDLDQGLETDSCASGINLWEIDSAKWDILIISFFSFLLELKLSRVNRKTRKQPHLVTPLCLMFEEAFLIFFFLFFHTNFADIVEVNCNNWVLYIGWERHSWFSGCHILYHIVYTVFELCCKVYVLKLTKSQHNLKAWKFIL